jgi:MraZ protein
MFRGRSYHIIDEKGRIAVPSRFREPLKSFGQDQLMVTNIFGYLPVFTLPVWQQIEEKLNRQVSFFDRKKMKSIRLLIGGAEPCSIDKQGRILIPPSLREYAGLEKEKDVVLVGLGNRFEIWSRERYENEMQEVQNDEYDEQVLSELAACLVSN